MNILSGPKHPMNPYGFIEVARVPSARAGSTSVDLPSKGHCNLNVVKSADPSARRVQ